MMSLLKYTSLLIAATGASAQSCAPSDADLLTVVNVMVAQSVKLDAQRNAISCLTGCIGGGSCTCDGGINGGTGGSPGSAVGGAVTIHVDPSYLASLGDPSVFDDCFIDAAEIASDPDAAALAASFQAATAASLGVDPSTIIISGLSTDSDPAPGCQGTQANAGIALTVDPAYASAMGDAGAFGDCWLTADEIASDPDAAAFAAAFIASTAAQLNVDPSTITMDGISTAGLAQSGCGWHCGAGATTTGGSVPEGSACVFPFTFDGVTYNECTDVSNDSTEWCALESDYAWVDASNPGLWGNCVCADPGAGR